MLLNCGGGEDSWESFGHKEIKSGNPEWNQHWIFIGRADAEAEALILWPPNVNSWLIGKDPDAGKDWGQEKRAAEDTVGWHHLWSQFEQIWGNSEGQGSLACCNVWGHKKLNTTLQLNNNTASIVQLSPPTGWAPDSPFWERHKDSWIQSLGFFFLAVCS